ncbi:hypothetical protein M569_11055, partial [Genlisea aurea]
MANSKYEYVKLFEEEDEIMLPNIIVVRVNGNEFRRFSQVHEFEKPNDVKALELMIECAKAVSEQFPDIVFSYGFSDEFSFIFKRATQFYHRRASKINSLVVSFFTSVYITKWKTIFCQKELRCAPSFRSQVIYCASLDVLQAYLFWRQYECHLNNQHHTCLWHLIKCGKSEKEANEMMKGSQKQDRNELLFQRFNINYKKDIPEIYRQGTCVLKAEVVSIPSLKLISLVEDVVKFKSDGCPVKRQRRKVTTLYSENIASRRFWNEQRCLTKELGYFTDDLNKTHSEYIKSFQYKSKLMPYTWIAIRIDGCHFHRQAASRFSEIHGYEKPNDAAALRLMNSCAANVLESFKDIVFAYGVSDEYSFVLRKESVFFGRRVSDLVSTVVSLFTSMFTMRWNDFFPYKGMKLPPYFDGRAICYPSSQILRDYLSWRQVDCHINNQYNTCFWMLVKSGKTKSEAQKLLK